MSSGMGEMRVLLLVVIPAHVFYLKHFEEYELELRMGQAYVEYKCQGRIERIS